ncbi:DUF6503 family protein [Salegentibacter mishustinae]|uniref:Deoxyribose-phosphate aldolase n=1 Tax=Salegentibacter mishustinae TaxID=270918 RepID=A0A0Q9ZN75_9FLAO|nr:DUF6503 family protein [Salegentibacter mishustinae]KRG30327.1 deoxyribose-phosphate aldolase [Salegentibacter mishustinae]PNW23223.1 deoxyribose-phosphate aldolase [Salegentibacter mishustinae]PZX66282.1 hypothetical protein LY54_00674 [Salegentibacter mishustinae]GGW81566.1 hypothetical protein GCM10008086_06460 [Salegentibacter mishustinae]
MKKYVLGLLIIALTYACNTKQETAQQIIDKAIAKAGGERYKNAEISFDFRKGIYKSERRGGDFKLERIMTDSTGTQYRDVVDNNGFTRFSKDTVVKLSDSMETVYANSVNSVHYFVQLPFGLNDDAVNKKLIGKDTINNKEYYEIKITFDVEGGGEDHEDVYMYWVNTQNYHVDYLAYSFEVNEGGLRFRKAYNPRTIEGIRFVDYENYKTDDLSTPLSELDDLYEARQLELLSKIENKNIEVKLLD